VNLAFRVLKSDACYVGAPKYDLEEEGFVFEPWGDASFSVMLGAAYVSLDIAAENGIAYYVSGCSPKRLWISQRLSTPDSTKGQLQVTSDTAFQRGTATDYRQGWQTFFDTSTGWICMGDRNEKKDCEVVEFGTNTLAVVKNGELKAVWVKPVFAE